MSDTDTANPEEFSLSQISDQDLASVIKKEDTSHFDPDEMTVWEAQNRRHKLVKVLEIWGEHQANERQLRRLVAIIILILLGFEVLAGNVAFFLYASGKIVAPQWVAETFYVGMYGQVVSIALIVVRGLFPPPKEDSIAQLNQMVDKL